MVSTSNDQKGNLLKKDLIVFRVLYCRLQSIKIFPVVRRSEKREGRPSVRRPYAVRISTTITNHYSHTQNALNLNSFSSHYHEIHTFQIWKYTCTRDCCKLIMSSSASNSSFLTVQGKPIIFEEDWDTGIGGGLWSTGLALARYFDTPHAASQARGRRKVLELGSGNGLLALCLLALLEDLETLVVTDLKDHLPLIRKTLAANGHLTKMARDVRITEHPWGDFDNDDLEQDFDLIVGSDVAYREELYDPLIASLLHFCSANTVVLLGVTMKDTKPEFFELLERSGFVYEKLADHLLELEFRGSTFGIFVLQRKK